MLNIKFIQKIIKNNTKFICVIALFISVQADAVSLYFEKPENDIKVGDTVILNVYIDSGDTEINGVEGVVKVSGPVTITNLNVAGSVFSLWPNKPSLSGDEVSFVGGSVSGFFGKKNKVFSIVFKSSDIGKVNFSLKEGDVFLNDGNGTKLAILGTKQSFDILKSNNKSNNQLADLILSDKIAPESFKIELGRDDSVYEGKYFVSFYTTDNDSGVNRYEVRENNLAAVRSGNTYILEDQSLKGRIEVNVIDNAGNIRTEVLNLKKENNIKYFTILIALVIIVLALLIGIYLKFKKKLKK
jgi:hypothetical protein